MPRTTKSAAELVEMVMAELRKHPECDVVQRIRIIRPVTKNWDVTIVRSYSHAYLPACRKILEATVKRLRARYDLRSKK